MKKVFFTLLPFMSFLLVGCWDEAQYKDVTIVPVMGITNDDGQVKTMYSYPTFENETINFSKSEGIGLSTRNSREDANHRTMEALDFAHLEVLLVSSDIAKKDLYEPIDMFYRFPRNRITSYIVIVDGDMEQYFSPSKDLKNDVADFYPELLRTAVLYTYVTENTLEETSKLLFDKSMHLSLPYMIMDDKGMPSIEGIALFSNGKFTGTTLKKQDAVLAAIMKKKLGKYTRLSYEWKEKNSPVTVQIHKVRRKMDISNNRIKVNYVIDIGVEEFPGNHLYKKEVRSEVEKFLAEVIKKDFEKIIKKTQESKSDIFGFGRQVHAFHQKLWKQADWSDTYATMPIEIDVKVKMKMTSILD